MGTSPVNRMRRSVDLEVLFRDAEGWKGVVDRLKTLGAELVSEADGVQENVTFVLPKPLQALLNSRKAASSVVSPSST